MWSGGGRSRVSLYGVGGQDPLPCDRQTDMTENITFPQLC